MGEITSLVIADAWKSDDKKTILDIYKKNPSLPVAGTLVFIGL
jgi:hypothetical protein